MVCTLYSLPRYIIAELGAEEWSQIGSEVVQPQRWGSSLNSFNELNQNGRGASSHYIYMCVCVCVFEYIYNQINKFQCKE
jgi:hypothetical protein